MKLAEAHERMVIAETILEQVTEELENYLKDKLPHTCCDLESLVGRLQKYRETIKEHEVWDE